MAPLRCVAALESALILASGSVGSANSVPVGAYQGKSDRHAPRWFTYVGHKGMLEELACLPFCTIHYKLNLQHTKCHQVN